MGVDQLQYSNTNRLASFRQTHLLSEDIITPRSDRSLRKTPKSQESFYHDYQDDTWVPQRCVATPMLSIKNRGIQSSIQQKPFDKEPGNDDISLWAEDTSTASLLQLRTPTIVHKQSYDPHAEELKENESIYQLAYWVTIAGIPSHLWDPSKLAIELFAGPIIDWGQ